MITEFSRLEKKLDDITSIIVRIKSNWTCIKCLRRYEPVYSRFNGLPRQNMLTASHFWNKWRHSVRWNYANIDSMCVFCHPEIEHRKHEDVNGFNYEEFMFKKLGQAGYEAMMLQAEKVEKFTIERMKIMLKFRRAEAQRLIHYVRYY